MASRAESRPSLADASTISLSAMSKALDSYAGGGAGDGGDGEGEGAGKSADSAQRMGRER